MHHHYILEKAPEELCGWKCAKICNLVKYSDKLIVIL